MPGVIANLLWQLQTHVVLPETAQLRECLTDRMEAKTKVIHRPG